MEDDHEFEDDNITVNKKYTFFVIDGSEAMFESTKKGEECEFKSALKLVLGEMLSICCQKSLNNQIGIIVTNMESSTDESLENCKVLMQMGVPGQEEVNEIKGLLEEDDIKKGFEKHSKESKACDLSVVFNYCKHQFQSFSNTRHQSVIYLTNDRNPFGRNDFWESSYFKRTKTAVSKIIGHGHRKTLGEFSVILLPEDSYKPEDPEERKKEPWFHLDTEVFNTECDYQRRIRQKTTATRSHANVTLNLGPGVSFDVGVYSLVSEAQPLKSTQKFSKSTEMPIQNVVGYIRVDNASSSSSNRKAGVPDDDQAAASEIGNIFSGKNVPDGYSSPASEPTLAEIKERLLEQVIRGETKKKNELKVSVTLGGEKIVITKEEKNAISGSVDKGIDLIGFCDQDAIDTELSVLKPKFLRPNEETTLGSTRIYRALLDRCFERRQAMICRYQTRSNEKLRIVALIPFKKESIADLGGDTKPSLKTLEKVRAQADASEFLHEGFHVISLPFSEEIKDEAQKFSEGAPSSGWPEPEEHEVDAAKKFVRKLTMSYNPSFYENPRLLSQRAALCERATGEELIERKDTLAPYHAYPERLARVQTEIDNLSEAFSLGELAKPDVKPAAKKRKTQKDKDADEFDDDETPPKKTKEIIGQSLRELYESKKLTKLTKDDLLELIDQFCKDSNAKKSMKKQELLDILNEFAKKNF